jgi:hypothetical protein
MHAAAGEVFDDGREPMFGEIPMYVVSTLRLPDLSILAEQILPYTDQVVALRTEWHFLAGRPVHELVDPTGHAYVMQTCSQHVDRALSIDDLRSLAARLQLPEGWEYRTRELELDLVVHAHDDAHIVLDELENNYQRHAS